MEKSPAARLPSFGDRSAPYYTSDMTESYADRMEIVKVCSASHFCRLGSAIRRAILDISARGLLYRPDCQWISSCKLQPYTDMDIHNRKYDRTYRLGDQPCEDRFNISHEMRPRFYVLQLPLQKILNVSQIRQMDLSRIDAIVIFCSTKYAGRAFQLSEIRRELRKALTENQW